MTKYYEIFGLRGLPFSQVHRLLKVLNREKVVFAEVPDHPSVRVQVRLGTSDPDVFHEIFVEEELTVVLDNPPEIIVDGGANVGYSSVFFALNYPEAKVFAIELECSNFKQLEANTATFKNIDPINAGLWGFNTDLMIIDEGRGKWGFSASPTREVEAGTKSPIVEAVTVESLLAKSPGSRIGILKLDIEGCEKSVFENCAQWIDQVDCLIVELHDDQVAGCAEAFFQAINGLDGDYSKLGEKVVFKAR